MFDIGRLRAVLALAIVCFTASTVPLSAGEVRIAVAANFTEAAKEIGTAFTAASGHQAIFSFASTGQLYAQIANAAPFSVFLAADQVRPQRAIDEGLAVVGTRFTYATGKIVLFSRDAALVRGEKTLTKAAFTRLAIANPLTAPYGAAAVAAMKSLGVYDALADKLVKGNNIAQAYQFVETGNAEVGFVALSQIAGMSGGSRWIVPAALYPPIAQDAVLLKSGEGNEAARAFLAFLKGPEARAIKQKFGYGPGE